MQTLANLSSSRDVLKMIDINLSSFHRLESFYKNYRDAVDFQLTRRAPDMIEVLLQEMNANTANTTSSPSIVNLQEFHHHTASSASSNNLTTTQSLYQNSSSTTSGGNNPMLGTLSRFNSTFRRRRSFLNRQSSASAPQLNQEAATTAVAILKNKVLGYNDRWAREKIKVISNVIGIIYLVFFNFKDVGSTARGDRWLAGESVWETCWYLTAVECFLQTDRWDYFHPLQERWVEKIKLFFHIVLFYIKYIYSSSHVMFKVFSLIIWNYHNNYSSFCIHHL